MDPLGAVCLLESIGVLQEIGNERRRLTKGEEMGDPFFNKEKMLKSVYAHSFPFVRWRDNALYWKTMLLYNEQYSENCYYCVLMQIASLPQLAKVAVAFGLSFYFETFLVSFKLA